MAENSVFGHTWPPKRILGAEGLLDGFGVVNYHNTMKKGIKLHNVVGLPFAFCMEQD